LASAEICTPRHRGPDRDRPFDVALDRIDADLDLERGKARGDFLAPVFDIGTRFVARQHTQHRHPRPHDVAEHRTRHAGPWRGRTRRTGHNGLDHYQTGCTDSRHGRPGANACWPSHPPRSKRDALKERAIEVKILHSGAWKSGARQ
jgi:hypothetical protein